LDTAAGQDLLFSDERLRVQKRRLERLLERPHRPRYL
jgi:hypothetical protein